MDVDFYDDVRGQKVAGTFLQQLNTQITTVAPHRLKHWLLPSDVILPLSNGPNTLHNPSESQL